LLFVISNLLIFAAFGALLFFELHTLPKNNGTMTLRGAELYESVTISRAAHGVMHVDSTDPDSQSHDDKDLFFGQGVAHAQERLWQMEFQRRITTGRLGEILPGGPIDAVVTIDKLARTLNFHGHAQTAFNYLSPRSRAIIESYCEGVNSYITTSGAYSTPLEFYILGLSVDELDLWTPTDVIAWSKVVSFMLSGNLDMELTRWDLRVLLGLEWDRIWQLLPRFDYERFPFVLEGELKPEDLNGFDYANDKREQPVEQWLRTPEGQAYWNKLHPSASAAGAADAASVGSAKQGKKKSTSAAPSPSAPFKLFRSIFGPSKASNNWVISGNRTQTGAPIMANDPHLQLMAPSIWHVLHLTSPSFSASGVSFVGMPGIILGHNRNISWGVTNVGADVQDLFIMNGSTSTHYWWRGQQHAYVLREERIGIKGGDDIVITVREAPHYGPVISDLAFGSIHDADLSGGPPLALRWVSLDANDTTFDAFLSLNTAMNWSDFQAAAALYRAPSQNLIFADAAGNIGYQTVGLIPIRPNNGTGLAPQPGTGEFDWVGWADFKDMPRVLNPKKGYIASANNAVVPPTYKVYLTGDWDSRSDGYRAKRITDKIVGQPWTPPQHPPHPHGPNAHPDDEPQPHDPHGPVPGRGHRHNVTTVQGMQTDVVSYLFGDFNASVLPRLTPSTHAGQQLLARWREGAAWKGDMTVGGSDAVLFQRFLISLQDLAAAETNSTEHGAGWVETQYLLAVLSGQISNDPNCNADAASTKIQADGGEQATILSCIHFASDRLDDIANNNGFTSEEYGNDCHKVTFMHQVLGSTALACLANRQVAHGGDASTINVGDVDTGSDSNVQNLVQLHGPSYRGIYDWTAVESRSMFMYGPGQSGNILSPFYSDLADMWADGSYLPLNKDEQVDYVLTLEPSSDN
jgi:penicillin amidase